MMVNLPTKILTVTMSVTHAGQRLDQALVAVFPQFTRSQLQQWIAAGHVRVGGRDPRKARSVARRRAGRDPRTVGARDHGARRGYPARCRLRGRRLAGDQQATGAGGPSGRRQPRGHAPQRLAASSAGARRVAARRHRSPPRQGHVGPAGGGEDRTGASASDRTARRAQRWSASTSR